MAVRSSSKFLPTKPILMFDTSFESFLCGENEFLKENYVNSLPKISKIKTCEKLTADLGGIGKNHGTQAFSNTYLHSHDDISNSIFEKNVLISDKCGSRSSM